MGIIMADDTPTKKAAARKAPAKKKAAARKAPAKKKAAAKKAAAPVQETSEPQDENVVRTVGDMLRRRNAAAKK